LYIVVPFDKKIVEKAVQFIEHEGNIEHGKNRVPDYFPKPLPPDSQFADLLPLWHV
jgi:hypothetical protein